MDVEPIEVPTVGESVLAPASAAAAPTVSVSTPPASRPSLVRAPEPALPLLTVPIVEPLVEPVVEPIGGPEGAPDIAGAAETLASEVAARRPCRPSR